MESVQWVAPEMCRVSILGWIADGLGQLDILPLGMPLGFYLCGPLCEGRLQTCMVSLMHLKRCKCLRMHITSGKRDGRELMKFILPCKPQLKQVMQQLWFSPISSPLLSDGDHDGM